MGIGDQLNTDYALGPGPRRATKIRELKMRYGQNCKVGKCRSNQYGTPTRDCVEKALSYFVILVLILLTE